MCTEKGGGPSDALYFRQQSLKPRNSTSNKTELIKKGGGGFHFQYMFSLCSFSTDFLQLKVHFTLILHSRQQNLEFQNTATNEPWSFLVCSESKTSLIEFQRLSSIYFTMFGNATARLLSTLWLHFIAFWKHRRPFCNLHVLTKNGEECFLLFHWTPQNPLNILVCWSVVKENQMAAIPADNAIINVDRETIFMSRWQEIVQQRYTSS